MLFPGEDKFLQQLAIEEQFGVTIDEKEMQKEKLGEKKGMGAAIAYNYSDPGAEPSSSNGRFSPTYLKPQSALIKGYKWVPNGISICYCMRVFLWHLVFNSRP